MKGVYEASHCVNIDPVQSIFWSTSFPHSNLLCKSPFSVRMRKKTDSKKLRICKLLTQCRSFATYDTIGIYHVTNQSWRMEMLKGVTDHPPHSHLKINTRYLYKSSKLPSYFLKLLIWDTVLRSFQEN